MAAAFSSTQQSRDYVLQSSLLAWLEEPVTNYPGLAEGGASAAVHDLRSHCHPTRAN